jgi:hypothetical protein
VAHGIQLPLRACCRVSKLERNGPNPGPKASPLRLWIGASLRLVSGTALTAANGLLGIASFTGTVPSLGGMTVPVAVGVAVSVHTGLGQVADGLEKIGGLMKEAAEASKTSTKRKSKRSR